MSRNAEFLDLILERAGEDLGHVRLLKLAYMADLLAWRVLGQPISEFQYKWHKHGPFDPTFYTALGELQERGRIEDRPNTTKDGHECSLVRRLQVSSVAEGFTRGQRHLVDLCVERYARLRLGELLRIVYATEPMKSAQPSLPLALEAQKNLDLERLGGVSLERILESEERIERGEWVDLGSFKRDLLGAQQ